MNKVAWKSLVGGLAMLAAAASASAAYPDRPISLVVGFSAGGGVDVVGRLLAQQLGDKLGASVVVENKAGFSGNLAAQQVKRALADGYSLLMTPATTYSLSQRLMGSQAVGYDLVKDFDAVTAVGEIPLVLLAHSSLKANSFDDLKARVASNGDQEAYGSSGVGSIEHVAMEMLRLKTGLDLIHVPYKGSSPTMTDLLGGQIDLAFATAPTALVNLPSGRVTAVGVSAPQRAGPLPDVPTFKEQGVDFSAASLFMILAPKGVDADRLEKLNKALTEALRSPEVVKKLADLGVAAKPSTLPEAAQRLQQEVGNWSQAIDQTGITVNSN